MLCDVVQNNCLDLSPACAGMTRIKDSCKNSGWDYLGPGVKPQDDNFFAKIVLNFVIPGRA